MKTETRADTQRILAMAEALYSEGSLGLPLIGGQLSCMDVARAVARTGLASEPRDPPHRPRLRGRAGRVGTLGRSWFRRAMDSGPLASRASCPRERLPRSPGLRPELAHVRLLREWWRVDPGGLVMLVGYTLAIVLGMVTVALIAKVA